MKKRIIKNLKEYIKLKTDTIKGIGGGIGIDTEGKYHVIHVVILVIVQIDIIIPFWKRKT